MLELSSSCTFLRAVERP